jgi:hypothetical protein
MTVEELGGGATVTVFLVSGTATLVDGARVESHEFGYSLDFTFPNIPVHGWEYIEVTGAGSAAYEVCYRSNTLGFQYVRAAAEVNGRLSSSSSGERRSPAAIRVTASPAPA